MEPRGEGWAREAVGGARPRPWHARARAGPPLHRLAPVGFWRGLVLASDGDWPRFDLVLGFLVHLSFYAFRRRLSFIIPPVFVYSPTR